MCGWAGRAGMCGWAGRADVCGWAAGRVGPAVLAKVLAGSISFLLFAAPTENKTSVLA